MDARVLDDVLHHTAGDVTNRHYNHADRGERLRAAWQLWADYVEVAVTRTYGATDTGVVGLSLK